MRASIATVGPEFSMARMLHEYVAGYYEPCATLGARLGRDGGAGARLLAEWEARVRAGWPQVTLAASGPSNGQVHVGQALGVKAILGTGGLRPEDLAVELVYGHEADGDLVDANVLTMLPDSGRTDGQSGYQVNFASPDSGLFSYGVRVRPQNENLPNPFATYLLRWA
jgi:starch phosphorylase